MIPAILAALTLILCAVLLRKGLHEQVWEANPSKVRRRAEDIVYGQGVWINLTDDGHPETPQAGIARLCKELGRDR